MIYAAGNNQHLASSQEEADTKIIIHAVDAYRQGATKIDIHSADTDVFILCLGHFDQLPEDTLFVTEGGQKRQKIKLAAVCDALGDLKIEFLLDSMRFLVLTLLDQCQVRIKYHVGMHSTMQNPLFMKPLVNLVMSHMRTALKMPLNGMYACFISQAQQLSVLLS